jgi:glutathionyl-hydroquinone reductase
MLLTVSCLCSLKALQRKGAPDLVPEALLRRIDDINSWVYTDVNDGAYRAGFASEQGAYDVAFDKFFAALDRAEAILDESRCCTY